MAVVPGKQNFRKFFGVEVPAVDFIYEDEQCVVFDEMRNPQAPVHFLVVPKNIIPRLMDTNDGDERLLGHLLLVVKKVIVDKNLDKSGYHVVVDEDYRSKTLKAIHVFGRALQHMLWPIGPGARL